MYDQEGYYTIKLPDLRTCGTLEVTPKSPMRLRKAVERFAYYFHREMGFDFVQFVAADKTPNYITYIFFDESRNVHCGACCFRWRKYTNHEPQWAMQWIWIHPYRRRSGILKKHWPMFDKLRPFLLERPVSPAMQGFINKYNDGKLQVEPQKNG